MPDLPSKSVLLDPREQPLIPLSVLQDVGLGSRSSLYELAKAGKLPIEVIRCGHNYRLRTIDVYRLTGLPVPGESIPEAS